MAVVAVPRSTRPPELEITQTHAEVTRDVVATLEPASRGYLLLLGLAVSLLVVSALLPGLGSTTAGRSTYFGASAASALFDASVALAGAGAVSLPASDKLRSPA